MGEQALAGITVLDLSEHIAGPFCSKLLADFGAVVIKVERPGIGDRSRQLGPFLRDEPDPEKSGLFLHLNGNKKSVTLDLDTVTGSEILKGLARQVDLIIEDLGPEGMAKRGLDYVSLAALNPGLVMTSISNFGTSGPYKNYKITDLVAYAMGGWMHHMGDPDKPPLQPNGDYVYYITGQFAAIGSLSALMHALWTRQGQQVSLSIMEAVLSVLFYETVLYSYTGNVRERQGNRWSGFGISLSIQPCQDGYLGFYVGPGEQRWQDLFNVMLGRPDMAMDPRFQTNQGRLDNADELESVVRDWLKDQKAEDVFRFGQDLRLLFSTIPTTAEILEFDQHKAREYFAEIEHPEAGKLVFTGPPFRMGGTPWQTRYPAPLLGQHNSEVYGEYLGLRGQDLAALRQTGII